MTTGNDDAEFVDKMLARAAERVSDDSRITIAHVRHHGPGPEPSRSDRPDESLPTLVAQRVSTLAEHIPRLWDHMWLPGTPPPRASVSFPRSASNDVHPVLTVTADLNDIDIAQAGDRLLVAGWRTELEDHRTLRATKDALTLSLNVATTTPSLSLRGESLAVTVPIDEFLAQLAQLPATIDIPQGAQ